MGKGTLFTAANRITCEFCGTDFFASNSGDRAFLLARHQRSCAETPEGKRRRSEIRLW